MPVSKLDAGAIDKIVRESQRQTRGIAKALTLQANDRQWTVELDDGEPDSMVANLDGAGVRLPDEPNPVGVGAAPDSLLRSANLAKVVAAAREEAPADARVLGFDIRPARISFLLDTGERALMLDYGYDAQLTSRTLRARMAADTPSLGWEDIDTEAPERMARTAGKLLDYKLADVQYVVVNLTPIPGRRGTLAMYFSDGHEPLYVVADLNGRKLGWPGRER